MHSTAIPVIDLQTGERYASIWKAAEWHGVTYDVMRKWLARPNSPFIAVGLKNTLRPGSMPVVHVPTGMVHPSIKAAACVAQAHARGPCIALQARA